METYTKEDIINAINQADSEVTDDCMALGVYILGAIILNTTEEKIIELLTNKTNLL